MEKLTQAQVKAEGIIIKKSAMWFKKTMNAQPGYLYLTPERLAFWYVGNPFLGIIFKLFIKSMRPQFMHNILIVDIKGVERGKIGANKNVLKVDIGAEKPLQFSVNKVDKWIEEIQNLMK